MGIFMSKEDRAEEKRLKKKAREEEKELKKELKEFDKEYEKEHPKEKADIFSLLFEKEVDDELEKELNSFLSESEKEELAQMDKENKRLTIKLGIGAGTIAIALISLFVVLKQVNKTDLEKITIPLMQDYYLNKYGTKTNIDNINELCTYVKNEKNETEQVCSGIYVATTEDDKHIISIKNEQIGDDVSISKIKQKYQDYSLEIMNSMDIVDTSPTLSYKDYYLNYNMYYDYIEVLPSNYEFDELYNSGKLTVTDVIIYQGDFNYETVKNLLVNLSNDSMFYFIKLEKGLPINLTIVNKFGAWSANVSTSIKQNKNITYYELSRDVNAVSKLSLSEVKGSDIVLLDDTKEVKKAYSITIKTESQNSNEPKKASFYLLSFDSGSLSTSNLIQFKGGYDNDYQELSKDEYKRVITFKSGGKVYLIANTNIYIANTSHKSNWLCEEYNICW